MSYGYKHQIAAHKNSGKHHGETEKAQVIERVDHADSNKPEDIFGIKNKIPTIETSKTSQVYAQTAKPKSEGSE
jgi:hypothetical protein